MVENVCYDYFRNSININNCFDIWNLVDLYDCIEFLDLVENFICFNFVVVFKLGDFNFLMVK